MKKFEIKVENYTVELAPEKIMTGDIIFPWEFNPNNVGLFIVFNEYGPLFAIWGEEHEILDIAVDSNLLDRCLIDEKEFSKMNEDEKEDITYLGNASEPFDITNINYKRVDLIKQDIKLLCKLAEARGANANNLDF